MVDFMEEVVAKFTIGYAHTATKPITQLKLVTFFMAFQHITNLLPSNGTKHANSANFAFNNSGCDS
jgi:hypothetical protein